MSRQSDICGAKTNSAAFFRTKDGGKTWQKILYRNDETGASDLIIDPTNPNTIYAAFWQISRKPYRMDSGGGGGGLFKSIDGGDSWTEISRAIKVCRPAFSARLILRFRPSTPIVCGQWSKPKKVDFSVRTTAARRGRKCQIIRISNSVRGISTAIYADTENENTVYVLNVGFFKSIDGGRNFASSQNAAQR